MNQEIHKAINSMRNEHCTILQDLNVDKSVELVTSQVKRIEKAKKGETILLMFPIKQNIISFDGDSIEWKSRETFGEDEWTHKQSLSSFMEIYSPIQKGDKEIFVKEAFRLYTETQIDYKADTPDINLGWELASKMTKEESRLRISECIDARTIRVQDILYTTRIIMFDDIDYNDLNTSLSDLIKYRHNESFEKYYDNQLKEQNINRTYDDNDYIFLIEVKV